jgi:hypothetical protein
MGGGHPALQPERLWGANKKRSGQARTERDSRAVLSYNRLHAVSIRPRLDASWNHPDKHQRGHTRGQLTPDGIYTAESGVTDRRQGDPFSTIASLQSGLAALERHENRAYITEHNSHSVRRFIRSLGWLNAKEDGLRSNRIVACRGQQDEERERSCKAEPPTRLTSSVAHVRTSSTE